MPKLQTWVSMLQEGVFKSFGADFISDDIGL